MSLVSTFCLISPVSFSWKIEKPGLSLANGQYTYGPPLDGLSRVERPSIDCEIDTPDIDCGIDV